ncbi:MAG: adenylate kinase family protein [Methanomassiliicoccales archaeon]|nr:adenylate kinase family protein [Methanomassiliicoccales archaeon]
MVIAITGTPGTGKSSVAAILRSRGFEIIEISDLAKEENIVCGYDEKRDSYEVDLSKLDEVLLKKIQRKDVFVVGHLSHLVDPDIIDMIIVLRCSPSVLGIRLRNLGWKEPKVRENMEAEACDVILIEALERSNEVYEIDTTSRTPEEVAVCIMEILAGEKEKYAYGNIDWSEEVLSWF